MWKVFELLYQVFMKNGTDHFTDMMPALHNYVTIDTDAFLSDEKRLLAIFNMCKEILTKDSGEDPESHAAKLLEVVLLQCRGKIDSAAPMLVELAATRLLREVKTSELRTMCLQVSLSQFVQCIFFCEHEVLLAGFDSGFVLQPPAFVWGVAENAGLH